ncbi:MAG TPA: 3',5'-cyclic-nucleotide phosphodiesterase [Candidatus Acidoferrales bacterium]|nr:3',5'-cyclic-nucleotide phosphodiesterase [Candidatus Acidoferrales bacterium]
MLGAYGAEGTTARPSAFLVNERTLIDAGSVGGALEIGEQLSVEHALISHSHLDHVAGLAFLTETMALSQAPRPVTLHAIGPVVESLRSSLFNDIVWTDFTRIPSPEKPVLQYRELTEDAAQRVGDLWVTPVRVDHTVPGSGFIVHDGTSGLAYSGDTGPTQALWDAVKQCPQVRAVILECSFPNRLAPIAEAAKHLTPELIASEIDKLPSHLPVWIFHIKPLVFDETVAELKQICGERVIVVEQGKTYEI